MWLAQDDNSSNSLVVGWVTLAVFSVGSLLSSLGVVKYYGDRHDSHPLTTTVAVLSLSCTLMCVLAVPIDILNVGSFVDATTGQLLPSAEIEHRETAIRQLYSVLYACLMVCGFIFIPFAYFYFEADHDNSTVAEKITSGVKYTTLFVVIVGVLLAIGVVAQLDTSSSGDESWIQHIAKDQTTGDSALTFAISCMSCIGLVGWCFYTAHGFVHVPYDMMATRLTPDMDVTDASDDLRDTKEAIRILQSKYTLTGRKMSRKDKRDLEKLLQEDRILERRCQRLEDNRGSVSCVFERLHPLLRVVGFLLLIAVIIVIAALLTTSIDKAQHSECQERCGWALNKRTFFNPIDESLIAIHQKGLYPLDYVVIGFLLVATVVCSLGGMIKLGIRFACIQMFELKPRASSPQGILLMAFHLMFIVLVVNVELLTFAPQYTTFGAQMTAENGEKRFCTLQNVGQQDGRCHMTQISVLLNQQMTNLPFFGILFYIGNWVFLGLVFLLTIVKIARHKSALSTNQASGQSRDPEENQRLL
eukprot:c11387_g1_i1.p1 GENE.c11387_g1_i1~~c11387_g1_i1.p1  ORF type:complete len:549 (-),score=149.90 c11387_g1_i1:164-1753(-)